MKHYAGLDLSMESTQVCIVDENGRKLVLEKVESSPEAIAMMLERYGPIERAVIETGRMSPAICLGLRELGVPAVCIDARQAHQSLKAMKANKTDPHDAAGLAQLARTGFYKEVHVKSSAAHGVRSVITARSHLVEARVRLDNTIRGLCATFGYRPGAGQGKAFLERIMKAAHIPGLGDAIASLLSVRAELVEQIKEMDRRLRLIASQSQACEILMTIPGVGVQTSAAFVAAVDEAGRFRQSRNARAYRRVPSSKSVLRSASTRLCPAGLRQLASRCPDRSAGQGQSNGGVVGGIIGDVPRRISTGAAIPPDAADHDAWKDHRYRPSSPPLPRDRSPVRCRQSVEIPRWSVDTARGCAARRLAGAGDLQGGTVGMVAPSGRPLTSGRAGVSMTEQPIARFAPDERTRLLAVRGVGPRVVERLEEIGIASLADLAIASAPDICGRTAAILGATCWKNSPQARAAIEAAIACAREE